MLVSRYRPTCLIIVFNAEVAFLGVNVTGLSLAQANLIIETALAVAGQRGYGSMAVAVLDNAGCLCALQRQAGASPFRIFWHPRQGVGVWHSRPAVLNRR